MVPFPPETVMLTVPGDSVEGNFNAAHEAMRLPVLRTAASLRNWGVLSRPVCEELKMAVAFIGACSILHSGLLMREDFSALATGAGFEQQQQHQQLHHCGEPRAALEDDHGPAVTTKALVIRTTLASMAKKIPCSDS